MVSSSVMLAKKPKPKSTIQKSPRLQYKTKASIWYQTRTVQASVLTPGKIKCSTWLKEYHKIQLEVLQNAGYDKAFFNSMEKGWVQKQAQAIESCEAPMIEWASNWSVHIDTKSNTKSVLEQIANANGISTKELFSGKYGNSYDEMLSNLILNRK